MKKYHKKTYRVKKSIFKSKVFWLVILFLFISSSLFYFLIFSSYFQIKEVRISGNVEVKTEDIGSIVQEQIENKLLFFNTKSLFLLSDKKLKENIEKKFIQIDRVDIKKSFAGIIDINIFERFALSFWCQEEKCFAIDEKGIVFKQVSSTRRLVFRSEVSNPDLSLGQVVISKSTYDTAFLISNSLLREFGIKSKEFIISLDQKKLTLLTADDWKAIFDMTGDIKEQALNLILVLKEKIDENKRNSLEYIDLRFGNKVYYK